MSVCVCEWDCVKIGFRRVVVISEVLKLPQVVKTFENTFHFLSLNWRASRFSQLLSPHTRTCTHTRTHTRTHTEVRWSRPALPWPLGSCSGGLSLTHTTTVPHSLSPVERLNIREVGSVKSEFMNRMLANFFPELHQSLQSCDVIQSFITNCTVSAQLTHTTRKQGNIIIGIGSPL